MRPNSLVNGKPYLPNLNSIQSERDMTDMILIITNPVRPKIESLMSSYGDEPGHYPCTTVLQYY